MLKDIGVQLKINCSAVKINQHEIDAIYEIGKELDIPVAVDTYMIPGLSDRSFPFEKQARLMPEDAAQIHWKVLSHDMSPESLHNHVHRMLSLIEQDDNPSYPATVSCLASNCSFAIDWRGNMRPCVTLEEPAVPVFELGFEDSWNKISKETKHFRLNKKCTACRLRPLCPTCAGSAWLETGKYDGVPEYLCRYSKELYKIMKAKETEWNGE